MKRRGYRPASDPRPEDLRAFVLEQWLPFVEHPPRPGFLGIPEDWLRIEAQRLWAEARWRWAQENGWPGGGVELLRENVAVRRGWSYEPREGRVVWMRLGDVNSPRRVMWA